MNSLKLQLLGAPQLFLDEQMLDVQRQKALAMLTYLAVTGNAQQRDTLAAMFWPESDQSRARASLRRDLSVLNKLLAEKWLEIEREWVALRPGYWLDVAQFRELLEEWRGHGHAAEVVCSACLPALRTAVTLYRDDFLTGFSLPDCPEFDEWQFFLAQDLRQGCFSALEKLVHGLTAQGELDAALPFARRWVALEPAHEPAHRQLMALYARRRQPAAAIRQYQLCVQTLQAELDVDPQPETTLLYEKIRRQPPAGAENEAPDPSPTTAGGHNIPTPATPFVGRLAGLTEISDRLGDPACRLLTLLGPGGIGKTRLAIEAARRFTDRSSDTLFPHGVYLVRLSSASHPDHLLSAMAAALNVTFYPDLEPRQQLINLLANKQILLVLDNMEHLLAERPSPAPADSGITNLISKLLNAAPGLKLLITSREALSLQEEWIVPVDGMRFPLEPPAEKADLTAYSAVRLFVESARRVNPDFDLAADRECVLQICRLLEGTPLALELAAGWLKLLPCAQIAARLQRNLDLLTSSLRNVPERHRSMRAVLAHSWELLSPAEQEQLLRLAVFRGGFTLEAASEVAGATLHDLVGLAEKSLLRGTSDGRYRMHQLLRQFGREQLFADPAAAADYHERHMEYFLSFLCRQESILAGKAQRDALITLREELGNLRLAWQTALEWVAAAEIGPALQTFYEFLRISSRFAEGAEAFRRAAARFADDKAAESLYARLRIREGAFNVALGAYGLARELLQESLRKTRRLKLDQDTAFALDLLGNIVDVQGDSPEATRLYKESLRLSRKINDPLGMASSLYNLGWISVGQGEYRQAQPYFRDCLTHYQRVQNQVGIAHALDSLGGTAFMLGEYADAEQYFQRCLTIFREIGDRLGEARALGGLGQVAWGKGDGYLDEAEIFMAESLQLARDVGHRLEIARRLAYLGTIANTQGDFARGERFSQEALALSREIGFTFGIPWSLSGLGTAVLGQNRPREAARFFYDGLEIALSARDLPVTLDIIVSLAALILHLQENNDAMRHPAQLPLAGAALSTVLAQPATWQVIGAKAERLLDAWRRAAGTTVLPNPDESIETVGRQLIDAQIGLEKPGLAI